MSMLNADMFGFLRQPQLEATLLRLYRETLRQGPALLWHFLPMLPRLWGKGVHWKHEDPSFYRDKYIPIHPEQGKFLYFQALALQARVIVEFGTSYGISTLYLAAAAQRTGGQVITCEYLPHKAAAARRNFAEAGVGEWIELREGDTLQTLKTLPAPADLVLLDGWPDLVFPVFQLLEPNLAPGAVIVVDDVQGFAPSMQDYLDYVRNPAYGYVSATIKLSKALEYTVKLRE